MVAHLTPPRVRHMECILLDCPGLPKILRTTPPGICLALSGGVCPWSSIVVEGLFGGWSNKSAVVTKTRITVAVF